MPADLCRLCRLPHTADVLCVQAQAAAMKKLLDLIGEPAICRGCSAPIYFVRHRNGKNVPYTSAGLNHFIDCPMAGDFARKPKS